MIPAEVHVKLDEDDVPFWREGRCVWMTEYGTVMGRTVRCGEVVARPLSVRPKLESFYCQEHVTEAREYY